MRKIPKNINDLIDPKKVMSEDPPVVSVGRIAVAAANAGHSSVVKAMSRGLAINGQWYISKVYQTAFQNGTLKSLIETDAMGNFVIPGDIFEDIIESPESGDLVRAILKKSRFDKKSHKSSMAKAFEFILSQADNVDLAQHTRGCTIESSDLKKVLNRAAEEMQVGFIAAMTRYWDVRTYLTEKDELFRKLARAKNYEGIKKAFKMNIIPRSSDSLLELAFAEDRPDVAVLAAQHLQDVKPKVGKFLLIKFETFKAADFPEADANLLEKWLGTPNLPCSDEAKDKLLGLALDSVSKDDAQLEVLVEDGGLGELKFSNFDTVLHIAPSKMHGIEAARSALYFYFGTTPEAAASTKEALFKEKAKHVFSEELEKRREERRVAEEARAAADRAAAEEEMTVQFERAVTGKDYAEMLRIVQEKSAYDGEPRTDYPSTLLRTALDMVVVDNYALVEEIVEKGLFDSQNAVDVSDLFKLAANTEHADLLDKMATLGVRFRFYHDKVTEAVEVALTKTPVFASAFVTALKNLRIGLHSPYEFLHAVARDDGAYFNQNWRTTIANLVKAAETAIEWGKENVFTALVRTGTFSKRRNWRFSNRHWALAAVLENDVEFFRSRDFQIQKFGRELQLSRADLREAAQKAVEWGKDAVRDELRVGRFRGNFDAEFWEGLEEEA